jgi:hypothetical protein
MRAHSSLAILFAAASLLAQSPALSPASGRQALEVKKQMQDLVPPPRNNQEGCPIVFTSARLDRPGEYVPTSPEARTRSKANLHLSYSNPTGKQIASIGLTGYLRIKQSRYALDATNITMPLTFSPATGELSTEASIPLLQDIVGFERLALDSVTYQDGSIWHAAKEHRSCSFGPQGMERVAK